MASVGIDTNKGDFSAHCPGTACCPAEPKEPVLPGDWGSQTTMMSHAAATTHLQNQAICAHDVLTPGQLVEGTHKPLKAKSGTLTSLPNPGAKYVNSKLLPDRSLQSHSSASSLPLLLRGFVPAGLAAAIPTALQLQVASLIYEKGCQHLPLTRHVLAPTVGPSACGTALSCRAATVSTPAHHTGADPAGVPS